MDELETGILNLQKQQAKLEEGISETEKDLEEQQLAVTKLEQDVLARITLAQALAFIESLGVAPEILKKLEASSEAPRGDASDAVQDWLERASTGVSTIHHAFSESDQLKESISAAISQSPLNFCEKLKDIVVSMKNNFGAVVPEILKGLQTRDAGVLQIANSLREISESYQRVTSGDFPQILKAIPGPPGLPYHEAEEETPEFLKNLVDQVLEEDEEVHQHQPAPATMKAMELRKLKFKFEQLATVDVFLGIHPLQSGKFLLSAINKIFTPLSQFHEHLFGYPKDDEKDEFFQKKMEIIHEILASPSGIDERQIASALDKFICFYFETLFVPNTRASTNNIVSTCLTSGIVSKSEDLLEFEHACSELVKINSKKTSESALETRKREQERQLEEVRKLLKEKQPAFAQFCWLHEPEFKYRKDHSKKEEKDIHSSDKERGDALDSSKGKRKPVKDETDREAHAHHAEKEKDFTLLPLPEGYQGFDESNLDLYTSLNRQLTPGATKDEGQAQGGSRGGKGANRGGRKGRRGGAGTENTSEAASIPGGIPKPAAGLRTSGTISSTSVTTSADIVVPKRSKLFYCFCNI